MESENKIKTELTRLKLIGKVKTIIEIEYKLARGLPVHQIKLDKSIFLFNEVGNLIDFSIYDPTSNYNHSNRYLYDEKGNMIEKTKCYSDGKLDSKQINKYDDKGNLIEKKEFNSAGLHVYKWFFKYDERGNEIEQIFNNADGFGVSSKATSKYDEKSNLTEVNLFNFGELTWKHNYVHDDRGNVIWKGIYKILNNNSDKNNVLDEEISYKYDYDKTGNWIKKTKLIMGSPEFPDGFPHILTEREIEYY